MENILKEIASISDVEETLYSRKNAIEVTINVIGKRLLLELNQLTKEKYPELLRGFNYYLRYHNDVVFEIDYYRSYITCYYVYDDNSRNMIFTKSVEAFIAPDFINDFLKAFDDEQSTLQQARISRKEEDIIALEAELSKLKGFVEKMCGENYVESDLRG